MYVDRVLPVARGCLATVPESALLKEAAQLLNDRKVNLVVACNADGAMVGVVSKTDVVRRIGHCAGGACTAAVATVSPAKPNLAIHSGPMRSRPRRSVGTR